MLVPSLIRTTIGTAFVTWGMLLICSQPSPAGDRAGCLSGVVVDNLGVPVVGIEVRLASAVPSDQVPAATTDEKGRFELDDIASGDYKVFAQSEALGYMFPDVELYRHSPPPNVSVPPNGVCVNVTVDVGAPAAHLTLKGRDSSSNELLGSLVATLGRPGHSPSDTLSMVLAAGQRDLLVPSLTEFDLELSTVGFRRTHFTVKPLNPGEVREFAFALEPVGLGCLTGTATDDAGSPVEGVTVELRPLDLGYWESLPKGRSDHEGHFTISGIHPASFAIFTSTGDGEYISTWDTLDDAEVPKVSVSASEACQTLALPLGPRTAQVLVKAIDAETGKPIPKLSLEFLKADKTQEGESLNGVIGVVHVPAFTKLTLAISAPGFRKTKPVAISPLEPGQIRRWSVRLKPSQESSTP
jgi:5-hydroxyisourate hydrolase-like protein (transthyretin family)